MCTNEVNNVAMSKRFLLLTLLIVVVAVLALSSNIFSAHDIRLVNVDATSLQWSGQNEGELVESRPSPLRDGLIGGLESSFNRFSLAVGVNKALERLGRVPLLPTLLPEGMKYADVYVGPDVVVTYGYEPGQDIHSGEIGIEISPGPYRVPTPEELRTYLSPEYQLIQIGDKWVEITDRAISGWNGERFNYANFVYDGLDYGIGARYPLTTQDLIKIIESMKTPY